MDSEDDASIGRVVGDRYRIVARRGVGTLGAVYDAIHTTTDQEIIVEVLDSAVVDREVVADSFLRSMRKISRLRHRSMAPIDSFGLTPDGDLYVAIARHRLPSLVEVVEEGGALPWSRARGMLLAIIETLRVAHRRSIFHGGLRPTAIFIGEGVGGKDDVRVSDFGMHDIAAATRFAANTRGSTTQLVGDPGYMALEQFVSGQASVAADIYALGAVLYYALAGQPPYGGVNAFHALSLNQEGSIVPVRQIEPTIPPEVEAIVVRMLAREPDERFSLDELDKALKAAPSQELTSVAASENPSPNPRPSPSPRPSIKLPPVTASVAVAETPPPAPPAAPTKPPVEAAPAPAPASVPPPTRPVLLLGAMPLGSMEDEEEHTVVRPPRQAPTVDEGPGHTLLLSIHPPSFDDDDPQTELLSMSDLQVPPAEPETTRVHLDGGSGEAGGTAIILPSTSTDPMLVAPSHGQTMVVSGKTLPTTPMVPSSKTVPTMPAASGKTVRTTPEVTCVAPSSSLSWRSVWVITAVLFAVGIFAGFLVDRAFAAASDGDKSDNTPSPQE